MSRTRIVATIGPRTANAEMLRALAEAGMNIARLNGSHGDLAWHAGAVALLRETLPEVPILLDIPGRKVRTLRLAREPVFAKGEQVVFTTDAGDDGAEKVPVDYPALHDDLAPGDCILADDGTLRFRVESIVGRDITCRAETGGCLKSRKGINIPHVKLRTQLLSDPDRAMIEFAREHEVDFLGISFVESAGHIDAVREAIGGAAPRIVSKVENQSGLDHLEEIVAATDAVMIDRGDLSVETNLEELSLFQKRILSLATNHGTPVIVATEMLHTMIANPYPTKAEVSDITNAVLDGCAATMLSGETAVGAYPVEAVALMRRVADAATHHMQAELDGRNSAQESNVPRAMEDAIALICRQLPITKIVAVTISGYAAQMVASGRPRQPILAVSNDRAAARSFNLLPGTEGVHVDLPFSRQSTDHVVRCLEELWRRSKLARDDLILVTAVGYPRSGTRMNLIQTHYVRDLIDTLGWSTTAAAPNKVDIAAARDKQ